MLRNRVDCENIIIEKGFMHFPRAYAIDIEIRSIELKNGGWEL